MIVILAPYFLPAVEPGGPIKSISGVSEILRDNFRHQIITRNTDFSGQLLDKNTLEKGVSYVSYVSPFQLYREFKKAKLIWLNSLYSIPFSFLPILVLCLFRNKKVLISPRGQLLKGAISPFKKKYLWVYKFIILSARNNVTIHYTHEDEKTNSDTIFKNFNSQVFLNPITEIFKLKPKIQRSASKDFTIGFFGRVVKKKNISFIISLLPFLTKNTTFHVHGFIEDKKYWKHCEKLIQELKLTERVIFFGTYSRADFNKKVDDVDLVVIPSFSENFCHVFFEAISMMRIVVSSDGLPWKDVNKIVPNTLLPLEEQLWVKRIKQIQNMTVADYASEVDELQKYCSKTKQYVSEDILVNFKDLMREQ